MSDRLLVTPVCQLCQIPAAMARSRCATRMNTPAGVRPACRSRPSWFLRVWLTDSIHCRTPQAQSDRLGERLELLTGETFVRQQDLATADQMMIVVQQRREHLTFPDL